MLQLFFAGTSGAYCFVTASHSITLCELVTYCHFARNRPMAVIDFMSALIAMICGIGYVATIMVGRSTYLAVAIAASLFSVSREIRNVTKGLRAGCAIVSSSKKASVIVPTSPPQKEKVHPTEPRRAVVPYVNGIKNMEVIVHGPGSVGGSKDS